MSRNGDVEEMNAATTSNTAGAATTSTTALRNRGDPFLIACRCFSFFTSLAAILCIAVNVLSAVRSFKHASDVRNLTSLSCFPLPSNNSAFFDFQIFDGIFRCYAVIIAAFVVLAETEWSFILKFSKVFFRLVVNTHVLSWCCYACCALLYFNWIEWLITGFGVLGCQGHAADLVRVPFHLLTIIILPLLSNLAYLHLLTIIINRCKSCDFIS